MALSIPITVAMTLGFCAMLGIDLQQISIAALIIALGLLVDDPVVACDAINRELAHGAPRDVAAWLGPQKLSRAILYATITNCVAFLPLLLVTGVVGEFIYSLPVVVTASPGGEPAGVDDVHPAAGLLHAPRPGRHGGGPGRRAARGRGSPGSTTGSPRCCMEHKWAALASCLVIMGGGVEPAAADRHQLLPQGPAQRLHRQPVPGRGDADPPDARPRRSRPSTTVEELAGRGGRGLHHVHRRRRPAVLAVGRPRAAGGQLRPDPGPHPRRPRRPRPWPCGSSRSCRRGRRASRWSSSRSRPARRSACRCRSGSRGADVATIRRLGEQVKGFMREFPGSDNIQDDWDPEVRPDGPDGRPDRANLAGRRPTRTWPRSWTAASPATSPRPSASATA